MGNVRSVVTEGRDTSFYQATMESARQAVEDALFANEYTPVNTITNKSVVPAFDSDTSNHKIVVLNGSANKVGPSLVLKVMAGDKVQLSTFAYYNTATAAPVGGVNLLSDILNVLTGGVVNNSPGKLNAGNTAAVNTALSPNVANFLTNDRPYDNSKPKAYLNWIFFDNQFNFVSGSSDVMQVDMTGSTSKKAMVPSLQTMPKNGYLYVYVSNESNQNVYFDDITVKHITGPLMQEQAYYPYGLEIQGLGDKAMMKSPVNYKYNGGNELEDEDGINYQNTFYRKYDAQIGRFTGIDVAASQYMATTPYAFGSNNPIIFNDPLGDKIISNVGNGVMSYSVQLGQGRMQRGTDNNYHVEWLSILQQDGNGDGGSEDFSGFWSTVLGAAFGSGSAIGNITTTIGGIQGNFGFSISNGWGFYDGSGLLITPGNTEESELVKLLERFAESGNSVITTRFYEMFQGSIVHNIFTDRNSMTSLPGVVKDATGVIIGTNTFFTTTTLNENSNKIPNNGYTNFRAQFAADFLSSTYLHAKGITQVAAYDKPAVGWFTNRGEAQMFNNSGRTNISAQTSRAWADRAYISNQTLGLYGFRERPYYAGLYLNPAGNAFSLQAGSVPEITRFGIFMYDAWHY